MTHSNVVSLSVPEKNRWFGADKISRYDIDKIDKKPATSIVYYKSRF